MSMLDRLLTRLPRLDLSSEVPIEVYLLHHGKGPEDYEILCDFERFLAEDQQGILARPVLRIWAGRPDFSRPQFARRLREAFTGQFEIVRLGFRARQQERARPRAGLSLSLTDIVTTILGAGASLLSSIVLHLAVRAGGSAIEDLRRWLGQSRIARALRGPTARARLEAEIEGKKAVIDRALEEIEIRLHRDLYLHAHRWGRAGPTEGLEVRAWPLPRFVSDRLRRQLS